MRVLLCGWFSFEPMGATAGDVQVRDLAGDWLREAGIAFDVANAPVFGTGLDWRRADPSRYTHLLFACGPFDPAREPVSRLLERYSGARLIGVDVSVERPLEEHDPFDLLLERDSSRATAPDLALAAPAGRLPVVGVVLVPHQREYGERARHGVAERLIADALGRRPVARVDLDTALNNEPESRDPASLRPAAAVESLIARVDVLLTTRLHGLVLALKAGVPVVAVDPVAGGAKVTRQAAVLGWPHVRSADEADEQWLSEALEQCLDPRARVAARECAGRAASELASVRARFLSALAAEAGAQPAPTRR